MPLPDGQSRPDGGKPETASTAQRALEEFLAKAQSAISPSAECFIQMAGMSDLYEIQAGQIAVRRSKQSAIRSFAKQMIADHLMANEELRAISGALDRTPPTTLDQFFQALIEHLTVCTDGDFDARYLAQEEAVDRVVLALLRTFRDRGDDSALRELCRLELPVIEHHIELVRQIRDAD